MGKIPYLDNLKVFLIALVVAHHAALAYQPGADWLVSDLQKSKWLSLLITSNATFFMGLFFFISAYFLPSSYQRTIGWRFFQKKLVRLGIPTLFTIAIVLPLTYFISYKGHLSFWKYYLEWFFTKAHFTFGHTWFIVQLLLYSMTYLACRKLFVREKPIALTHRLILFYSLGLFVVTWLVSLYYPQDTWRLHHLLEPYHLPQYISLFALGILAWENKWLDTLDRKLGYTWLAIGIGSIGVYALHLDYGFYFPLTLWSAFMCTSMCVGLITFFRDFMNQNGTLHQYLAGNAYSVYLVHVLIVVFIQWMILSLSWNATIKFWCVFILSYIATNLLCGWMRKNDMIRRF